MCVIYSIYPSLFPPWSSGSLVLHLKWERDLEKSLTTEDWEANHTLNHKGSLNINIKECGFKLQTGGAIVLLELYIYIIQL